MLQTFKNEEFGEIRTIKLDGVPWFVGKDVAKALEYSNPPKAIRDHVDDEDKQSLDRDKKVNETFTFDENKRCETHPFDEATDTLDGHPQTILINESGLYSLIMSSKLPSAKAFKRWVTSEVLPAIRETGAYTIDPRSTDTPSTPDSATPVKFMTSSECLSIARLLATCPPDRLAAVAKVLTMGGWDLGGAASSSACSFGLLPQIDTGGIADKISDLVNTYHLSYTEIAFRCGVSVWELMNYVSRRAFPGTEKYNRLILELDRMAEEEENLIVIADYTE
ncbi:MAG: hypothetical protein IJW55_07535 [Clostridia bacterium]|nr:hypothetical protein [Clostridia bacterium]